MSNVKNSNEVKQVGNQIEIGCRVTWSQLEKELATFFPEFTNLIKVFASPQIKNTGTLVGNIANGSPIGDGIPFLLVSKSELEIKGRNGIRKVPLEQFYKGYKQMDIALDEFISKVIITIPKKEEITKLYKVSIRKDLDISAVTFAANFKIVKGLFQNVHIAFGGVGPIVHRMPVAEKKLNGMSFNEQSVRDVFPEIDKGIAPMSDHRGSKEYRHLLAKNLLLKCFLEVKEEQNL